MCQGLFTLITPTFGNIATTFFFLSAIIAALGNTFCLIVLWQPSQRTKSNKILTSLALSDCLVGYIVFPLAIWLIQNGWRNNQTTCIIEDIYLLFAIWMFGCTSASIFFIAFDRYLLITRLSSYNNILTHRNIGSYIIFYWLITLGVAIGCILNTHIYIWGNILATWANVLSMCICYYLIVKSVRQSRQRINKNNVNDKKEQQYHIRLAKKVTIVIAMYIVSLLPAQIFLTLIQINKAIPGLLSANFKTHLYVVVSYVGLSNACVNPIIYISKDQDFKTVCKKLLRVCMKKRVCINESNAMISSIGNCGINTHSTIVARKFRE